MQFSPANIINHMGLVLDASSSMGSHRDRLIEAADAQIQHLAARSKELDQETRISVWTFSDPDNIRCVVWDKDVLRLPSIRPYYSVGGMTALVDATMRAIKDLAETPERYGDHSFLLYVLTDGQENRSTIRPGDLISRIAHLPENWTLAALVPNIAGVAEAKRFGFPAGNIERWDTASATGATEAGATIRRATDAYMTARSTGVRSTRTLFSTGADAVNAQAVSEAGLTPLAGDTYVRSVVAKDSTIRDYVEDVLKLTFRVGHGYYQLAKAEAIQSYKQVLVVERRGDGRVFSGPEARKMIGLPDMDVRVSPDWNPDYHVFVQSTSTNRRLRAGTDFIYLR